MSSNLDTCRKRIVGLLPGSIVVRTTLSILALSLFLGLIFAATVSFRTEANEERRLEIALRELLSTVDDTTQIACFLGDATLAKEISQGLLRSHSVTAVRIVASGRTIYESARAGAAASHPVGFRAISRTISSPFDTARHIGEITLYASDAEIRTQARRYSFNTTLVLGLQMTLVAAGVALVVFVRVTRPIRGISDELHLLKASTGMLLRTPPGNASNEIGRLVADVNALIGHLTALLNSERELRMEHAVQERKMRLLFEKASTGIVLLDTSGVVQSWNPAFACILGLGERVIGSQNQRLEDILASRGVSIGDWVQNALLTGVASECDLEIKGPGPQESKWVELSLNPISTTVVQGIVNDITERKHTELSARRLASHDALTGLLNRHGIESSLTHLFQHLSPERLRQCALLQIDLDYFKQVNDTYGHDAGDRVLCCVARALESVVRRSDLVGRQGGDEFVAVLVGIESATKAQQIAENMIARIREPIALGGGNWARVGASVGMAFPSGVDESPDAVLRRADAAMYVAKQKGRCRACIAPPVSVPESTAIVVTRGAA